MRSLGIHCPGSKGDSPQCPRFICHLKNAASMALRGFPLTSNIASRYSLSVVVNAGPPAHVCRPVYQQTLCLPGVHGYLLQAETLRRTVPKPRDTSYPELLLMEPDDPQNASISVSTALHSSLGGSTTRLLLAPSTLLERNPKTEHLLKAPR